MTAPATADDQLRVVVDIRTAETVFGPANRDETSTWIIQDGFWRGGDLAVKVLPAESIASRSLREAAESAQRGALWADPLTRTERREVAARLARASKRYGFKEDDGTYSPSRVSAGAECRDLHLDVTERAEVAR